MSTENRARYPKMQISIASPNPLALVAAVREELRLAGAGRDEIARFSEQAMAAGREPEAVRRVVDEWIGDPS